MGSSAMNIDGVTRRSDLLWAKPHSILIPGFDKNEAIGDSNWFAFCPRVDRPIDDAFLASVRESGVREPIDAYRDGTRIGALAGRRRVRAARAVWDEQAKNGIAESQRITVPFVIRKGSPDELFLVNVEENAQRADLTPVDRAQLMQHMLNRGASKITVGIAFGCTARTVDNAITVLECSPKVQRALSEGSLPVTSAVDFAKMPRGDQDSALSRMLDEGTTKGSAVKEHLRAARTGTSPKGKGGNVVRMRSRAFIEKWREIVASQTGRTATIAKQIADFLLGDDDAFEGDDFDMLQAAATQAGERKVPIAKGKKQAAG
jgi:ParB-like chromosome segregation protein Spo0J